MGIASDFGTAFTLGNNAIGSMAEDDPYTGAMVGAMMGGASTGFNPYGIAAGAVSGGAKGQLGKQQKKLAKEEQTLLTELSLENQAALDEALKIKDPRRRDNTLLTSGGASNTTSLLG